jgi:hypothetical protein
MSTTTQKVAALFLAQPWEITPQLLVVLDGSFLGTIAQALSQPFSQMDQPPLE